MWDFAARRGVDAVEALSDEDFLAGLHEVNRYFVQNEAERHGYALAPFAGPQSLEERHVAARVDYAGAPRRFRYYSAAIFRRTLAGLNAVATPARGTLAEGAAASAEPAATPAPAASGWVEPEVVRGVWDLSGVTERQFMEALRLTSLRMTDCTLSGPSARPATTAGRRASRIGTVATEHA